MADEIFLIVKDNRPKPNYQDVWLPIVQKREVNFKDFSVSQAKSLFQLLYARRDKFLDLLTEKGISSIIGAEPLTEAIIKKGVAEVTVIDVFKKYLEKINIDNELIIVDPYFFSGLTVGTYDDLVSQILRDFLPNIDTIIWITNNKVNAAIKTAVIAKLMVIKPSLS